MVMIKQRGGNGTIKVIIRQIKLLELGPVGKGIVRKCFGEEVVLKVDKLESFQLPNVIEVALHVVIINGKELQILQLAHRGGELALDHVVGKDNDTQILHGVEGVGQRSGNVEIVLEGEDAEVGELLELLGDGPGHVIVGEPNLGDGTLVGAPLAVRAPEVDLLSLGVDLVPLALVLAGKEGEGVEPVVSLGGVVEGGEGVALDELARLGGAEVVGIGGDGNSEGVLLGDPLESLVLRSRGVGQVVLEGNAGRH
mmetsp:Transcript_1729/g.3812  ORF Transcript_1729/g.3812 Transcript_1729/m.3812 type:complete len:254 (-) Transcript_1729:629-1390(-)